MPPWRPTKPLDLKRPNSLRSALKPLDRFKDRSRVEHDGEENLAFPSKFTVEFSQVVRHRPVLELNGSQIDLMRAVKLLRPDQRSNTCIVLPLDRFFP